MKKHQLEISEIPRVWESKVNICTYPALTEKIKKISMYSSRTQSAIYLYFVRRTITEMTWDEVVAYQLPVHRWYEHKPIKAFMPRLLFQSLHDIAWRHGVQYVTQGSKSGGGGYLIGLCAHIQIRKQPIDYWIDYFLNGKDLVDTVLGECFDG